MHSIVFGIGRKVWNGPLVDTVGVGQGLGQELGQGQGLGQEIGPASRDGVGINNDVDGDDGDDGDDDDNNNKDDRHHRRYRLPVHLICLSPQEAVVVAYSAFTHQLCDSNSSGNGRGGVDGGGGNSAVIGGNSGSGGVGSGGGNGRGGNSSGSSASIDIPGALCSYSLNGRWLKSAIVDERINAMIISQVM